MDSSLGNLKEYALDRRCQKDDIAMFLSQVASALHYLHVNHIVHGDLRAEYVNVLASDKVCSGQILACKGRRVCQFLLVASCESIRLL